MMPNFLGVGFFRCGTSWLHEVLDSHPQAYVPQRVKEIHYFYPETIGRGRQWYESFFPADSDAAQYQAIGEIGPGYAMKGCIDEIAKEPAIRKFIFMVRAHADRIYSVYQHKARMLAHPDPFAEWLGDREELLQSRGYAHHIEGWIERFGRENVLVMALEHVHGDSRTELDRLAAILEIDPAGFVVPAEGKVNASHAPRFRRAYRAATKANAWLYRRGLFRVSKWLKDRGAKRLFGFSQGYRFPPLADEDRLRIEEFMEPDTQAVEGLAQLDLSSWRKTRSN